MWSSKSTISEQFPRKPFDFGNNRERPKETALARGASATYILKITPEVVLSYATDFRNLTKMRFAKRETTLVLKDAALFIRYINWGS